MKKTIIAILALMLLGACNFNSTNSTNMEEVKQGIIEQERGRLPLLLQHFDEVTDITIDSIVILNNINPHHGYLVTTWEYKKLFSNSPETETVYVEIDSLMIGKEDFSWKTDWPRAYLEVVY